MKLVKAPLNEEGTFSWKVSYYPVRTRRFNAGTKTPPTPTRVQNSLLMQAQIIKWNGLYTLSMRVLNLPPPQGCRTMPTIPEK
jgi:hypothetical protein